MGNYVGDVAAGSIVRIAFNTRDATGAPITLAGTPAISVYKTGSTTEVTTGVTLVVDYDSRTGFHIVSIDTSSDGTFYAAAADYRAVLTAGTVSGISVVGVEVGCFSIANRIVSQVTGSVNSVSSAVTTTDSSNISAILGKLTGITYLARWLGAIAGKTTDSSTLAEINATTAGATYDNVTKSLEAQTGGGGGTIQNNITIPSAVAQASITAALITAVRGDVLSVALPVMGDITSRSGTNKLVFTAKVSASDADSDAIIQVKESIGLTILNGSTSVTAGHASLTVTNATTGAVTLVLNGTETAQLAVRDLVWDCQALLTSGPYTPINGGFSVVADVTKLTS